MSQNNKKKIKNGHFSFVVVDIWQLPHTVISNSEKLTHPSVHSVQGRQRIEEGPAAFDHRHELFSMGSEFWIQLCSEVLLLSFLMSVSYKIWWELPVFSALAVAAWLPVNQSVWAQFSRSSASTAEVVYY